MSNKSPNHLHRYKKVNLSRNKREFLVYKCIKPECSHYIRTDLAEGKLCECSRCGKPMIIGKVTLTQSSGKPMTNPHCLNCIKRKKVTDVEKITDFLEWGIPGVKAQT